jgi:hypothetical protein
MAWKKKKRRCLNSSTFILIRRKKEKILALRIIIRHEMLRPEYMQSF